MGPGLVTEIELAVTLAKLRHKLLRRRLRVIDLAQIADLAIAAGFGDRHGVAQLRCIDPYENLCIILHGSSPLR